MKRTINTTTSTIEDEILQDGQSTAGADQNAWTACSGEICSAA